MDTKHPEPLCITYSDAELRRPEKPRPAPIAGTMQPTAELLAKLGQIIVYTEGGICRLDLVRDPDVQAWIKGMRFLGLIK